MIGALSVVLILVLVVGLFFKSLPAADPWLSDRVLSAVAKFGQQRSGRARNTFYFPTNANLGDQMVIYWREENLFFSFPTNVGADAVSSPSLVVQHVWELNEKSFRLPGDKEAATSTYLQSWPQALKWMRDAVVDGQQLVLEHHEPFANLPQNP